MDQSIRMAVCTDSQESCFNACSVCVSVCLKSCMETLISGTVFPSVSHKIKVATEGEMPVQHSKPHCTELPVGSAWYIPSMNVSGVYIDSLCKNHNFPLC